MSTQASALLWLIRQHTRDMIRMGEHPSQYIVVLPVSMAEALRIEVERDINGDFEQRQALASKFNVVLEPVALPTELPSAIYGCEIEWADIDEGVIFKRRHERLS